MDNLLQLKPLKLRKIEVKENPFSIGNDKYKKKLFDMLPTLKIIDQTDKNGDDEETTDYHYEEEENGSSGKKRKTPKKKNINLGDGKNSKSKKIGKLDSFLKNKDDIEMEDQISNLASDNKDNDNEVGINILDNFQGWLAQKKKFWKKRRRDN